MRVDDKAWIEKSAANELIGLLLENVPAAIAVFDRKMRYVAVNRRWISDYNRPERNVIGRSQYELFPEVADEWRSLHQRALSGETLSHDGDLFPRCDGKNDRVRWHFAPFHDAVGQVQGVLLITHIVAAQAEDELRLRIMIGEMSQLLETSEDMALFILDDDGRIVRWNAGAERMFGWNEKEVLGRSFDCLFDVADQVLGLPDRQLQAARGSRTFQERCWRIRKDGSRFLGDSTISYIDGDDLLPGGFGHVVRDVTREDSQTRSIEASSVLLRSILDTVPDAMIVIDDKGTVLSFSKAAEQCFGYQSDEILGRNVSVLMPSLDREQHDGYLSRYLKTGKPQIIGSNRRVIGLRKDGTVFPHTLHIGEAIGGGKRLFAGFVHDLSEAEAAEARLRELQRELSHIARISEMGTLATAMAHELNQPLMAIGNMVQTSSELVKAELAKNHANDPAILATVVKALEEAGKEAIRAGAIIKRLRGFVSRGELERTIEEPGALVRDACALIASDAKFRNIHCSVSVADGAKDILVDRVQVQQVALNLLHNATQAIGRDGVVRVDIRRDGPMIEFRVWDSGPGVRREGIEQLFEPFSTTKPDGMGMGLSICRTIVEAHGGKIWYEEGGTDGAAFLFTMPRLRREEEDVF